MLHIFYLSEELERQRRDLTSRRLQDMARTQQMMEYERQVYTMEQEKERLLGITMKQRVRIDELELKYEPGKEKYIQGTHGIGKTGKMAQKILSGKTQGI